MKIASPNVVAHSKYGPIIVNVHDRFISQEIFTNGYYAIEEIGLILNLVNTQLASKDSVVIYDVGANIGTHSLALARQFGARVHIEAFEAQPMLFNMLCGTMALNGIENVFSHFNVISNTSGQFVDVSVPDYHVPNNLGGLEVLTPAQTDNQDMVKSGKTYRVPTISIDQINGHVDFIKMDIEGMEHLALQGATKKIEEYRPFCVIEMIKTDQSFVINFFKSVVSQRLHAEGL